MKFIVVVIVVTLCFRATELKGQVLPADSLVLVDLYNLTNGSSWTNNANWLSGPISTWYGIQVSGVNVSSVFLSNNNLGGTLPTSIGSLSELIYLYLDRNNLLGTIPPEVGSLLKLKYLRLYDNEFSGDIPVSVGDLVNLNELLLDGNQLTGSLPTSVTMLSNLEYLGLYNNQLTGTLPPEIGNLTSLKSLVLLNNSLSGSIPDEIGNLTNLAYLDLGNNNFSGSIPASIGYLINIKYLALYLNNLTGSIPPELGNITELRTLYLYGNMLTGSIPDELGNLINLESLNLDHNALTETLPASFGNLINMQHLVVSQNNLSGRVPESITNLVNLINLNVSHNEFTVLPDISVTAPGLTNILMEGNRLSFDDILPYISSTGLIYVPQDSIDAFIDTILYIGSESYLSVSDNSIGNIYKWTKDGNDLTETGNISGSRSSMLSINPVSVSDTGYYSCVLNNPSVPNLTLFRRLIKVQVTEAPKVQELKVYELLSPNGDGKNETFFVENIEFSPENELSILNRWGNLVYRKQNYKNDWNGEGLPDGSYFYVFKTKAPEVIYQGGFMITH